MCPYLSIGSRKITIILASGTKCLIISALIFPPLLGSGTMVHGEASTEI